MLVLVKALENKKLFARVRVDVSLQTLGAELFHHALHGRVYRSYRDVLLFQMGLKVVVGKVISQ